MSELAGPLLLVGCGKMGTALLRGWIERGLPKEDVVVVEPAAAARAAIGSLGVRAVGEASAIPAARAFRAVLFAVKPQMMATVLPDYADLVRSQVVEHDGVVISIAAGTGVARFEAAFGAATPVVRAMPNTPAAIGKGVTALFANPQVGAAQRALAGALMAAVGAVHWVDDEALMHAVTAMSGGGPAYVFLLIETLARAGIASGLPAELAWPMARATVAGSGALAASSDEPAETLRQNVTSPGGTTAAALGILMAPDALQPLFDRAIGAAVQRSRELS